MTKKSKIKAFQQFPDKHITITKEGRLYVEKDQTYAWDKNEPRWVPEAVFYDDIDHALQAAYKTQEEFSVFAPSTIKEFYEISKKLCKRWVVRDGIMFSIDTQNGYKLLDRFQPFAPIMISHTQSVIIEDGIMTVSNEIVKAFECEFNNEPNQYYFYIFRPIWSFLTTNN